MESIYSRVWYETQVEAQSFKMYILSQNTPQLFQVSNLEDISLSK